MKALPAWRFLVVGLTLASAGCYRDLDYSHIKCDVTAKNPCPDGYLCNPAGLCDRALGAPDASVIDAGPSMADTAPFDWLQPDATTLDESSPVDLSTPQVDVASVVDTTLDGAASDKPQESSSGSDVGADFAFQMMPNLRMACGWRPVPMRAANPRGYQRHPSGVERR
jgi:hypothetical protein